MSQTSFTFSKVPISKAGEAFACHKTIACTNTHIWPRSEAEIQKYCEDGALFCARRNDGQLVALCYAALNEASTEWEVGGLTVDAAVQNLGIGTTLLRYVLGHTMAFTQPWKNGQQIIAHVHEANEEPRRILERLGFSHTRRIAVPATDAPEGMKRNEKGELVGDEFQFTKDGLVNLAKWFREFDGTLGLAKVSAEFRLASGSVDDLRQALDEMAKE